MYSTDISYDVHDKTDTSLESIDSSNNLKPNKEKIKSVPVQLYIDYDIRSYLKLKNHERKSRIYIQQNPDILTIKLIREIIENKITSLSNQSYILRYASVDKITKLLKFKNDDSVKELFMNTSNIIKPPIQLFVENAPGIFPPSSI